MQPPHQSAHPYLYDTLDKQLISILRKDARASISKLAQVLQVSRGTVQNRLDRLVSSGAILGFTIRAHEQIESNVVRAIMMIEVVGRSTTQVINKLRGIPQLEKLHTTNGAWDLVADIRATSLEEFDKVLREVRTIEGVLNSETSILLSTV
ncbi:MULTISPECIES: Lrp/AsnC family transcriptional regulator [unclassified Shewanella]|jgi:DNA-binding Lrp family transcriptional regulator|uniref:Lrp/AsnC family transcriptional regulator n=1 Tax=unclassified Shewanella TaxID=196818 RepID=UPI000C345A2B|nr:MULTISPECIES: Lrp/AsnC family transcriptional regulator [unclassified Shewanella]MBB1362947.1 Lrp/AsnC family transcriptional regulator [Shewanella sp. SR44-4]PKH29096.1 AsnC family transcriptional regulator [Shewanella sp. ALD9]QHS13368.1 Lrp/AsnC family transcriptional regulator [Shewanella sp. Arc9-LZ]